MGPIDLSRKAHGSVSDQCMFYDGGTRAQGRRATDGARQAKQHLHPMALRREV